MKNLLNEITNTDCILSLEQLTPSSIDLIVTSPPYNLGIPYDNYDDNQPIEKYFIFIEQVAKRIFTVLKDDGRVCINVPIDGSMIIEKNEKEKIDIIFRIKSIFYKVGFKYKDQILWDKEHLSSNTAWGSYESASCPNILLPFESILVFYKKSKKKQAPHQTKEIIDTDFQRFTNGHWQIKGVTKKSSKKDSKSVCPVPFPEELVKRLILLYSYRNDIVLDPFSGSGTTCVVAKKLGRQFIGFEKSEKYYNESIKRIKKI